MQVACNRCDGVGRSGYWGRTVSPVQFLRRVAASAQTTIAVLGKKKPREIPRNWRCSGEEYASSAHQGLQCLREYPDWTSYIPVKSSEAKQ